MSGGGLDMERSDSVICGPLERVNQQMSPSVCETR